MSKKKEKQIQLTFFDSAKLVLTQFKAENGNIAADYCRNTLYTSVFDRLKSNADHVDTMPAATSLDNLFVMLGATPRKSADVIQNNFMWENKDGTIGTVENSKSFYLNAIFSMVNFINVSVYLYHKLPLLGRQEMQKPMLSFLTVAAASAYKELYSDRSKYEFAYYFRKVLKNHSNLNTDITPFNSKSWRSEFNSLTKVAKAGIDEELDAIDMDVKSIYISNLNLTIGNIADRRINPDESRYTIEAGVAAMNSDSYDRVFISTIEK